MQCSNIIIDMEDENKTVVIQGFNTQPSWNILFIYFNRSFFCEQENICIEQVEIQY